jgi:hypothetical protein
MMPEMPVFGDWPWLWTSRLAYSQAFEFRAKMDAV